MRQENSGSLVAPNGAWCCSAAVARRHDAEVGRRGPGLASSARSRPRGDVPAPEEDGTAGARERVGGIVDAFRAGDGLPDEEPQPTTVSAADIATAAVTEARDCTKRTAHPRVRRSGGRRWSRRPSMGVTLRASAQDACSRVPAPAESHRPTLSERLVAPREDRGRFARRAGSLPLRDRGAAAWRAATETPFVPDRQ